MSQLSHHRWEHPSDAHASANADADADAHAHAHVHPNAHAHAFHHPQFQQQQQQQQQAQYQNQDHPVSGPPYTPVSPTHAPQLDLTPESPTIGRPQVRRQYSSPALSPITIAPLGAHASGSTTLSSSPTSPLSGAGARFRKPAPSPLQNTTAISPPNSPSHSKPRFNVAFGAHGSPITSPTTPSVSEAFTKTDAEPISTRHQPSDSLDSERSYYHSDSSGTETPEDTSESRTQSPRFPNDGRSVSDPVKKPLGISTNPSSQATMPGSSRMDDVKAAPRNSSIDSAISAISIGSSVPKHPQDGSSSPADISKLIKAAGSPEAVIQYLLKEKQSASQQNSQLWRLVDKQRAMILGLNKDLERALKDKERYRKKLKEVMASQTIPPVPSEMTVAQTPDQGSASSHTRAEAGASKEPTLEIPGSPSVESEGMRNSPIDVALAPYPLTPPADRYSNGLPSAVGEMLNPSHAMPEASEHALDHFDHEAQDRAAEEARKKADAKSDLPISLSIPPSRSLPDQPPPPQGAPPAPPQRILRSDSDDADGDDDGLSNFPSPPVQSPRKAPPAPLKLKDSKMSPTFSPEEAIESDSDYDGILEVDEIAIEKRGRRRTRQEDNELREILAVQEAEARSVSKKSKQSSSAKGKPEETVPEIQLSTSSPHGSPVIPDSPGAPSSLGSLAGMLSGDFTSVSMPLLSPGLPSSPRPMQVGSGPNSPPLSPRYNGLGMPLSPRAPRQPIPLPPNTPLETPSRTNEQLALRSPQPLNIGRAVAEPQSETSSSGNRDSAIERTNIFKGFMTDEFPDMLLPPNAIPSIILKVASSRMKPSRASLISLTQLEEDPVFTLAVHSRHDGGELWRVEKDSTSLMKLDQRLKQCPAFTARTPDRSLFSGHAPAKLDARRQALDQYLDELLNTPLDTATAVELCWYLSTNVLPPNADEMGSSTGPSDEGAPRMGPGGRQYRSGYLTKRGKNFGGWKARFFACEGPHLKYYETPGGAHLGTIKLPGAQIGRQAHQSSETSSPARVNDEMDNQYRHAFLILEPKKKDPSAMTKHLLCAESDRERDQWVQVLLQWTNYKDPADEDNKRDHARDHAQAHAQAHAHAQAQSQAHSHAHAHAHAPAHDRQVSGQSHAKGAHTKKRTQGRPQQHQAKDSEDALIGVSYEATRAGDVPLMGTHSEPSPTTTSSSQPLYSISAPRDPQVISDMSMWGNKMGNPVSYGMDEKKAKKRSFFGFGPKQRSSSDGADSLDNTGPSGQSKDSYTGPVRRVFGAPLAEAVRYNSPRDVRIPLPAVVYRCIQYLDARGAVIEEGIFRLSGSNLVIKQLKERFDNEGDINLLAEDEQYHDIHAIASMLKAYLRELPTSILTRDLHLDFVAVTEMNSQAEKIAALAEIVPRLPQANATLLKYLIAFLIKVINHSDQNKMTVRNVGIVFSPTLTIPAPVFALFLQNYEAIFGIVPEEYELPSPISFEEQQEIGMASDLPPRPSTSGGIRESPHRHRLAEALQEGRRGNTPPPASLSSFGAYSQARSTPTPPLAQARSYDPTYFPQQHGAGSSHVSARQAYENMMAPTGFDHPVQQRMANSIYGGPALDIGTSYDHNVRASRRESSIMMNVPRGLTPQSSMGRLTEES